MVLNNSFISNVNKVTNSNANTVIQPKKNEPQEASAFANILKEKVQEDQQLKFSKHAELRMKKRNINLTQTQQKKKNQAVDKAASKGIRDSLVIMDNLAFVVNINNRVVVTAVNNDELKENVFTNIDGAVFA